MQFNMLGRTISITKPVAKPGDNFQVPEDKRSIQPVDELVVKDMVTDLMAYQTWKQPIDMKIIENEEWYKLQHWKLINTPKDAEEIAMPEPVTAFLVNSIMNKHADAMDNYPEPVLLGREAMDAPEADSLSKIVPTVIESNGFKKTYSRAWYYKLKQGTAVYGVFFNPDLNNGEGDIEIKKLDLLRMYWQPMIEDIQDSRRLFIVSLIETAVLKQTYPKIDIPSDGYGSGAVQIKDYFKDYNIDLTNYTMVVDCYEKFNVSGTNIVHLTKFVGSVPLESSRNDKETRYTGIYDHGKYPTVFDVFLPEEGTPIGFGLIDIAKNPQAYIDKLDQIIDRNALVAGKQRHLVSENAGIDTKALMDLSQDIIKVQGSVGEDKIRPFQAAPLHPFIREHRQDKIMELKDTVGNRDFQAGGTAGGVTAYGAIMALQEAGNKLSRDMISESYMAYAEIVTMCVELIGQFYSEDRKFRITGEDGDEYITYNNQGLQPQQLPPSFPAEGMIEQSDPMDPEGMATMLVPDPEYVPKYRRPVFDLKIKAQKSNPFNTVAQNQMVMDMYKMGMFNPEQAPAATIALEAMSFEGKEKIMKMVRVNGDLFMQMQQMQMQYEQQMMGMRGTMDKMAQVIQHTTGQTVESGDDMNTAAKPAGASQPPPKVRGTGQRPQTQSIGG